MRITVLASDRERMIRLIKEHNVNKLDNIKFAVCSTTDELNSTIIKNIKLNGGL
jgi:Na+-transporting methylmalonyl-CoA/oxaloacetate decarboxylase beta subunit